MAHLRSQSTKMAWRLVVIISVLISSFFAIASPRSFEKQHTEPEHLGEESTLELAREPSDVLEVKITERLKSFRHELEGVQCGPSCSQAWLSRESQWRHDAHAAEAARLRTHARLFREFLPESRARVVSLIDHQQGYIGIFSPLDYYEAEFSCGLERRIPHDVVGDGPKWVCGIEFHGKPCSIVSLGSNYDDAFEMGVSRATGCHAYIVDPTLPRGGGKRFDAFKAHVAAYGAQINASVGVGNGLLESEGRVYRLVRLSSLLSDRNLRHVAVLKMDIEGSEYDAMRDLAELCASHQVTIDQLNVELHITRNLTLNKVYDLFNHARTCGLLLHHKERNAWGCRGITCVEFSWISLQFAAKLMSKQKSLSVPTLLPTSVPNVDENIVP